MLVSLPGHPNVGQVTHLRVGHLLLGATACLLAICCVCIFAARWTLRARSLLLERAGRQRGWETHLLLVSAFIRRHSLLSCSTLRCNRHYHSVRQLAADYARPLPLGCSTLAATSITTERVRYPLIAPGCCSQLQHSLLQSASPLRVLGSLPIAPGRCSAAAHLLPPASPLSVFAIR